MNSSTTVIVPKISLQSAQFHNLCKIANERLVTPMQEKQREPKTTLIEWLILTLWVPDLTFVVSLKLYQEAGQCLYAGTVAEMGPSYFAPFKKY